MADKDRKISSMDAEIVRLSESVLELTDKIKELEEVNIKLQVSTRWVAPRDITLKFKQDFERAPTLDRSADEILEKTEEEKYPSTRNETRDSSCSRPNRWLIPVSELPPKYTPIHDQYDQKK